MNNTAVIVKIRNVKKHSNADRLQIGEVLGTQVIVGLDTVEEELGIYFDSNLQLSEEFAKANDLIRRTDENGNKAGGMFDDNRKVHTQKLRGEKSDGFWCGVKYLEFTKYDISKLKEGFEFVELNSVPICNKYISKKTQKQISDNKNKKDKKQFKVPLTVFPENPDTEHLIKHLQDIPNNKTIIISEKCHGTALRFGNVKVNKSLNWWQELLYKIGIKVDTSEYKNIVGSHHVVKTDLIVERLVSFEKYWIDKRLDLKKAWFKEFYKEYFKSDISEELFRDIFPLDNEDANIYNNFSFFENKLNIPIDTFKNWIFANYYNSNTGFYSKDIWTEAAQCLKGKLHKNELIYGEVCGWLNNDSAIMGVYDNKKMGKEFVKKYGDKTIFSYGAEKGKHKLFIYRITMSNGDGFELDYSWDNLKQRCEELGVEHVPELAIMNSFEFFEDKRVFMDKIEGLVVGCSTLDPTHLREGVCVRVDDGLNMKVFKHKSFDFKLLEGIIKLDENFVDVEESN